MSEESAAFHYFANPTRVARQAMAGGRLGAILTPKQGNRPPDVRYRCADNGCFGEGYPGDQRWIDWLRQMPYDRTNVSSPPHPTSWAMPPRP